MTDRHAGYIVTLAEDIREPATEAVINALRMVKGVIPCTEPVRFCKGWKHVAYLHYGPVGPHYCEGRSVNPLAEPAHEAESTVDTT